MWPFTEPKTHIYIHEYDLDKPRIPWQNPRNNQGYIYSRIVPYAGEEIVYKKPTGWHRAIVHRVSHNTNSNKNDIESVDLVVIDVQENAGLKI